jgi:hypothetical protein
MKKSISNLSRLTLKLDFIYNEFIKVLEESKILDDNELDDILINYFENRFKKLFSLTELEINNKECENEEFYFIYVSNIKYLTNYWLKILKIYKSMEFEFEVKTIMQYIEDLNKQADIETSKLNKIKNDIHGRSIIEFNNEYIIKNNLNDTNFKINDLIKYIEN